ncbi:MAG TPA: type II toxin-antitoxin system RelE/ParE family toxin [Desulfobacterales bacterium]|nr:type II toxin-antitoxin system RelE/ParE family toxin [Desulfobacterales bacterium]
MSYKLKFLPSALREWRKLAPEIKEQFKLHLSHRLENPHIDNARIRGYKHHYKIKIRAAGYRLIYEVEEKAITVYVICVGRRDTIYKILKKRKPKITDGQPAPNFK